MLNNRMRVVRTALFAAAVATLGSAASASAELLGEFTRFQQCPWTNTEVKQCLYMQSEGGTLTLGKKKIPIEKQVVLQGGFGEPVSKISPFFAATNGITLTKASQSVPGGLAGLIPEGKTPPLIKSLIKFYFENALTGVNATLELAEPASDIGFGKLNLLDGEGVALKLPLMVHLENPFLGKGCYVGESGSPMVWELTTGVTAPEKPNTPITGAPGVSKFLEKKQILELSKNELVDNKWSAPSANGCGGGLSFLVDPIINEQFGNLAAGNNTAVLKNTIYTSAAAAVQLNHDIG
jgi:hypothetical protein